MPTSQPIDARQVKEANRRLYDAAAQDYESIDGRRTPALHAYLQSQLQRVRQESSGGRFLDLGCGSGFAAVCARGIFDFRVGVDLSPKILDVWRDNFDETRTGDVDQVPYSDGSFDAIAGFALLHHLPETDGLAREAARLLAPGGVLYTDHDMDQTFFRRFGPLIRLYRMFRGAEEHYAEAGVEEADYHLAECRADGIDTTAFVHQLRNYGLQVRTEFHWYGLASPTDRVFGQRIFTQGWAPLARVIARKPPQEPQS